MARIPDFFGRREQRALAAPLEAAGVRGRHVAGHPECNKDIDPDGSDRNGPGALCRRQAFAERRRRAGTRLPLHAGLAGPAKRDRPIEFTSRLRAAPPAAPAATA